MKYINNARTVEELIKILEKLPLDATITVAGDYSNVAEIWYNECNNDIEIA